MPPLARGSQALLARETPAAAGKRLIVINPNASKLISIRKWPLERYAELVRRLLQDPRNACAITGVASEWEDAKFIADRVKSDRLINLTGKTTLEELIGLFNIAEVLVTNDSGPAHFAALTDIDVIVFFGPETPDALQARSPIARPCSMPASRAVRVCRRSTSADRSAPTTAACRTSQSRRCMPQFLAGSNGALGDGPRETSPTSTASVIVRSASSSTAPIERRTWLATALLLVWIATCSIRTVTRATASPTTTRPIVTDASDLLSNPRLAGKALVHGLLPSLGRVHVSAGRHADVHRGLAGRRRQGLGVPSAQSALASRNGRAAFWF